MTKSARKPLRRTAWGMLLGGLGMLALMFGVGTYVVNVKGESAGPDRAATWPAGTDIAVFRPLGSQPESRELASIVCTVTPQDGRPLLRWPTWGERMRPDFAGPATITCRYPVKVLTGPAITIANITRGPLIAVPGVAAILGILIFFPRFTMVWAWLSPYRSRLLTRVLHGRDTNRGPCRRHAAQRTNAASRRRSRSSGVWRGQLTHFSWPGAS